jgi:hypothetical protein
MLRGERAGGGPGVPTRPARSAGRRFAGHPGVRRTVVLRSSELFIVSQHDRDALGDRDARGERAALGDRDAGEPRAALGDRAASGPLRRPAQPPHSTRVR